MLKYKQLSNNELKNYISSRNKKLVLWGLSRKTKSIIEKKIFNINSIIDKDIKKQDSFFCNIPIVSYEKLDIEHNILVLLGNHVEEILLDLEKLNYSGEIILAVDEIPSLLGTSKEYFSNNLKLNVKKELFKKMVQHIEIEPHSYCNRTCWFCPNSYIDRKSNIHYFDEDKLTQLLKDLKEIDYSNKIAFTRYSEPFSNEKFYPTLKKVRNYLPNAILHANTNADFLTNETLEKAHKNGLNSLFIQVYLGKNEEFNHESILKKARKILNRVSNIKAKLKVKKFDWLEYECSYEDMDIRMYARDFSVNGVNRGGIEVLQNKYERFSPCSMVFTDVYIDYNSKMVPCCNIRSDNKSQNKMITGELENKKNSIFENYFSSEIIKWRKSLFNFNKKKISPCDECSFSILNKNKIVESHMITILEDIKSKN